MKDSLRKLFWPLLRRFEEAEGQFVYKPSHRKALLAVGILFFILSAASFYGVWVSKAFGAMLPVIIFAGAAVVCSAVALLGNDRAVAKIWNSRQ